MTVYLKGMTKAVKKTLSPRHVMQFDYLKSIVNEVYGRQAHHSLHDWDLFYSIQLYLIRLDIEFKMRTHSAVLVIDGNPSPNFTAGKGVSYYKPKPYKGWHLKLIELEEEE